MPDPKLSTGSRELCDSLPGRVRHILQRGVLTLAYLRETESGMPQKHGQDRQTHLGLCWVAKNNQTGQYAATAREQDSTLLVVLGAGRV